MWKEGTVLFPTEVVHLSALMGLVYCGAFCVRVLFQIIVVQSSNGPECALAKQAGITLM